MAATMQANDLLESGMEAAAPIKVSAVAVGENVDVWQVIEFTALSDDGRNLSIATVRCACPGRHLVKRRTNSSIKLTGTSTVSPIHFEASLTPGGSPPERGVDTSRAWITLDLDLRSSRFKPASSSNKSFVFSKAASTFGVKPDSAASSTFAPREPNGI
jgi:hypothetical protein